uniref:NADH dehydrogenase subunit 4 n=1 Tax=Dipterosiphonia australica TaxID=2007208 RepID=UPI0022FD92D6|nr:NADH dehydrogenase subunit 4 [Dipterosiphonia australica]WAX04241.1 NADH dehydrogenase subunit 4 [Dipterosiphonia australica]
MFNFTFNPLLTLLFFPLCGLFFLLIFIPDTKKNLIKVFSLLITSITFLISLFLWINFYESTSQFQFFTTYTVIPFFNINYTIGLDGISLFFILLSTFLINLCVLISWESPKFFVKEYFLCFLFLEFCLLQIFCVLDILLFYIFFESVLIPMFLIIGIWGSRERKIRAAFQFFLYTLVGSLFMLGAICFIYAIKGTTDLQILWFTNFPFSLQLILWILFFFGFAVKIPMFPFHIWLPEAHAEAPTAGSVILAGVLLKLGGYGFLRFSLPLFPYASLFFNPFVFILSLIAIVYGSLTTLRQIDLKKIIAYSSISHMGFVTLGIFSLNINGIEGSILLMLSHGLISSAMFFCIGILYDRYGSRILKYFNGLVQVMPLFTIFFMFFSFANISFPGTSSFIGELLILVGLSKISFSLVAFALLGVLFSASYAIWLLNRISFGTLNLFYLNQFQDISRREFWILLALSFLVLWLGIYPSSFLYEINFSTFNLFKHLSL